MKGGNRSGPRPKLPKSMLPALQNTSRCWTKKKSSTSRREVVRWAIWFNELEGGERERRKFCVKVNKILP